MVKTRKMQLAPFSERQKEYIRGCQDAVFNIAEGAVRSGKTVCNVIAFALALEKSPDRIHLATGVTLPIACLNIGDCNGFGLEHIFRGRCRWGKHRGNTCLFVRTSTGEKAVIFAGGGKADSYKKIRGGSFGMWIATEINKHYIAPGEECFLREAFNRQLAAKSRKVFWDLNPDYPAHPIYRDFIDSYRKNDLLRVNYMHFTMADNMSVSEERRREIEAQYDPGSIWYKRSILGERVAGEGLIFPSFAQNPEKYIVPAPPGEVEFVTVGVDFGGNKSKTAFAAAGILKDRRGVCILASQTVAGVKGEICPDRIDSEFVAFVRSVEEKYGAEVRFAFCDCENQYLVNGLRKAAALDGLSVRVGDCLKKPINERICAKSGMMASGKWTVLADAVTVIDSTASQIWDPVKPDTRLDDGTVDIDTSDAEEYSWERFGYAFM